MQAHETIYTSCHDHNAIRMEALKRIESPRSLVAVSNYRIHIVIHYTVFFLDLATDLDKDATNSFWGESCETSEDNLFEQIHSFSMDGYPPPPIPPPNPQ